MSAKSTIGAECLVAESASAADHTNFRVELKTARSIKTDNVSAPPRCLVLAGAEQSVETGPIDRIDNADEDFDVILAMARGGLPARSSETDVLMARCSNPAAPLISCSQNIDARVDVALSDTSSTSIASALILVQPLVKRLAALPRIAQGVDRHRLLALTLAYTRNLALEAKWAPDGEAMVCYPLLLGIPNPRSMLEELASSDLLRRRFFERVFICGQCSSSRLMVREVCVKCRSSDIEEHPLLHHYSCGFQGARPLFRKGDGYLCPKCEKHLHHYGLDYDKPGTTVECHACHDVMSEPDVYFVCTDCGCSQPSDGAARQTWYHYDITADGIAAVQAGALPRSDAEEPDNKRHSLRDFRVLSRQALALAAEHARPIAAFRMTIDASSVRGALGPARVREVILFAHEIATECLRGGDIAAALPDGIIVCLPEADRSVAEKVASQIERAIAGSIKPGLSIAFQIYAGQSIGRLFEALR